MTEKTQPRSLADALLAAQVAMESPKFDAKNPAFKSRYASLAEITRVAKTALNAEGIAIVQPISGTDGTITIETTLIGHGETLSLGSLTANLPAKPQEAGSLITYYRRYALSAALALVADDDDDANVAQAGAAQAEREQRKAEIEAAQRADFAKVMEQVETDQRKLVESKIKALRDAGDQQVIELVRGWLNEHDAQRLSDLDATKLTELATVIGQHAKTEEVAG